MHRIGRHKHRGSLPMLKLNSSQRTAAAVIGAACVTTIAIHNPIKGYEFTERQYGGGLKFKEEWQDSRSGCTPELREEMLRLKREINASGMTIGEKAVAEMSGKPVEIYKQCMLVTTWTEPPTFESEPPWNWQSQGALLPVLAPMVNVIYTLSFIGIWGAVALFALRASKRVDG